MGIPWSEAHLAADLIGEKIVVNEFVAYVHMNEIREQLSQRTLIILSYALCGFANFGSIGILIGGLSSMAPNQQKLVAQLGLKSVLGGTLAAFMTAATVSFFLS